MVVLAGSYLRPGFLFTFKLITMSKTIIKNIEDCTPFELFQMQRYGNILKSQSYQRRRHEENPTDEAAEAFEEWMSLEAELQRQDNEDHCGSTFDHNF